jgi:hypothetical protein
MNNMKKNTYILAVVVITTVVFTNCKKESFLSANAGGGTTEGVYLGIIGFNDNLTTEGIRRLTNSTRHQFQLFVNNLTMRNATGLFYAVDNAINMLQAAMLPPDLVNISIITFTDGLDNFSIELNPNHSTINAYRDVVRNRINTTRINNLPINAYSVGIKGNDVTDTNAFRVGLTALASRSANVFEVTDMNQVDSIFHRIAATLHNSTQESALMLRIPGGYDDGTRIRFTFDWGGIDTADNSQHFIEGVYRRNTRTLENITYRGLTSNSGTTVTGEFRDGFVTFTFEDVSISTISTQQWWRTSTQWQINSEFNRATDAEIVVRSRSAIVLLVLDCSSSLGTAGFNQMKNAANNFTSVLLTGGIAQVRFQKINAPFVAGMRIQDQSNLVQAVHFFESASEISPYYEVFEGRHYPRYLYNGNPDFADGWWLNNAMLPGFWFYLGAGRRYTVIYDRSRADFIRIVEDATTF